MKAIQASVLMICILLLAGAAGAQTVMVQHTVDYRDATWSNDYWFAEPGDILDHYPVCRGSNQDWGWTHDVADSVPAGATGIQSATLTIVAWMIDAEEGEDDVIYALAEQPETTTGIWRIGTELGLLKSYLEAPIEVPWSSHGQILSYADLWSVTTFDLPAQVLDDLWTNGELYLHIDIDQEGYDGLRATLKSSMLQINYFAPEPVAPPTAVVHRFWSPLTSSHFYTISEAEVQTLLADYSWAWTYEGAAYRALADDSDPRAVPVHRFWSPVAGGHFFTVNEAEVDELLANWTNVWTYEGVAFYAYPEGQQPADAYPVYRFWSDLVSHHFYTISEAEAQTVINEFSWAWTFEGTAWYALMP